MGGRSAPVFALWSPLLLCELGDACSSSKLDGSRGAAHLLQVRSEGSCAPVDCGQREVHRRQVRSSSKAGDDVEGGLKAVLARPQETHVQLPGGGAAMEATILSTRIQQRTLGVKIDS